MKADYVNDGLKNTGVSIVASIEETVIIAGALQDKLKKSKEFLSFYSDKDNITFFEDEGIDRNKEIEKCKSKINKLMQMIQVI